MYKIIILGPQASGKGTQAEFLAEKLNVPNISVGQLLRDEVENKGELSSMIKEQMDSGGLVSNAIVDKLVKKRLMQPDAQSGFIFDGFPRIRIQARVLATITNLTHVIVVEISDAEALNRLSGRRTCPKCGKVYHLKFSPPKTEGICDEDNEKLIIRSDDTPEAIRARLKIYHEETEEVIEFYDKQGIVIRINGEQPIEDVKKEIFEKLNLN
ncbi:MAG TPA: nucleoside monophosphate kinase [bacterium]|nr:nucleoside monophosphate kinase [bacterium]HPL95661.1 nucleoside monophosphate kinase [bacterium]